MTCAAARTLAITRKQQSRRHRAYAEIVSARTWQVAADVVFPNEFPLDIIDGTPQLPQQLRPRSRIPTQQRYVDDAIVFVVPGEPKRVPGLEHDLRFGLASVIVRLACDSKDGSEAATAATVLLDRVLESLSFQMQVALEIYGLEALDMSGSPQPGDTRSFSRWSGWATPTTSMPMQSLVGRLVPDLNVDLSPTDQRANRALDWYLKALTARFEADHFIFLWIAAEILAADSPLKVSEPYRGPACGHVIDRCPECGAETTKPVQGASMKRYLTEGFGLDEAAATGIWRARQMLHGAHSFDSKIMESLAESSQQLRYVVMSHLKQRLGMSAEDPPFAAPAGLSISPFVGVGGTREVTEVDLNPLGYEPGSRGDVSSRT